MSPFALGANRPGFPTTIIIALSVLVSTMMLVAGLLLLVLDDDYAIYGLGLVVFYLFLASYMYLRLGLLVIKSSIGHSSRCYQVSFSRLPHHPWPGRTHLHVS